MGSDQSAGFSLRIEVAGEYYEITGESGHSEKKLTSSFYRLMKFSLKIPCSSRRILRSPMLNEHPESVWQNGKHALMGRRIDREMDFLQTD